MADQLRPQLPKLATLMDEAETDMTLETISSLSVDPLVRLPAVAA